MSKETAKDVDGKSRSSSLHLRVKDTNNRQTPAKRRYANSPGVDIFIYTHMCVWYVYVMCTIALCVNLHLHWNKYTCILCIHIIIYTPSIYTNVCACVCKEMLPAPLMKRNIIALNPQLVDQLGSRTQILCHFKPHEQTSDSAHACAWTSKGDPKDFRSDYSTGESTGDSHSWLSNHSLCSPLPSKIWVGDFPCMTGQHPFGCRDRGAKAPVAKIQLSDDIRCPRVPEALAAFRDLLLVPRFIDLMM